MSRRKNRRRKQKLRYQNGELTEVKSMEQSKAPKSVENVATNFTLYIPRYIHDKVMYWVNKSNYEISGFGSVEYDQENNYFVVTDVCILKQKVSAASTELDPHAIGKAMYDMRDDPGALKWHWHSHVNMSVFWSSDDKEVIRSLGQQGWIVASVFNKSREVLSAFYTTTEVMGRKHDIFVEKIDTQVYFELPKEDRDALDALYTEHVEVEKPPVTHHAHGSWDSTKKLWVPWAEKTSLPTGTSSEALSLLADEDDELGEISEADLQEQIFNEWQDRMALDSDVPSGQAHYNPQGYTKIQGVWLYNPVFDEELTTDLERFHMIEDMDDKEIALLRRHDHKFSALLARYFVNKAKDFNHAAE